MPPLSTFLVVFAAQLGVSAVMWRVRRSNAADAKAKREATANARAAYNLGVTLAEARDDVGAMAAFEQALALDPAYRDAACNLATILLSANDPSLRDPARAVALANDECTRSRHANAAHLGTLAAAYEAIGDYPNAVEAQRKAFLHAAPDDSAEAEAKLAALTAKAARGSTASSPSAPR